MADWYLYARISDESRQGDGYSIDAQVEQGQIYALKETGHLVPQSNIFIEKETAKASGRPIFENMIAQIRASNKPSVILVEKTDRLYRNFDDMVAIDALIKQKGVEIHLYKEGEVLKKGLSSHKKIMHRFKVLMAEGYIDNLREEAQKGTLQKLSNGGWPNRAPYGYLNMKKEVVIDENKAAFVREVFSLYASGLYSMDRLSEKLLEEGYIYTPSTPKIHKGSLELMLKNPFYIGEMHHNGVVYKGKHEPLISMEVWTATQRALRKGNKPMNYGRQNFKYSRLIVCGECGGSIVGESKKQGLYTYYRCASKKVGCSQGYVAEGKIDNQINAMIESIQITRDLKLEILKAMHEIEPLQQQTRQEELARIAAGIDKAHKRKHQAYMDRLEGIIDERLFADVSQAAMQEIHGLMVQQERLNQAEESILDIAKMLVELPKQLMDVWFSASNEEKMIILNLLGSNFSLKDGNLDYKLEEPLSLFSKGALSQTWWADKDRCRTAVMLNYRNIKALASAFSA